MPEGSQNKHACKQKMDSRRNLDAGLLVGSRRETTGTNPKSLSFFLFPLIEVVWRVRESYLVWCGMRENHIASFFFLAFSTNEPCVFFSCFSGILFCSGLL